MISVGRQLVVNSLQIKAQGDIMEPVYLTVRHQIFSLKNKMMRRIPPTGSRQSIQYK